MSCCLSQGLLLKLSTSPAKCISQDVKVGGGGVYKYEDFSTPLFKSIGLKRTFTSNSLEVQPANSLQVACSSLKTHVPINSIMFSFACPTHFTCITHLANEIMDKAHNAM